MSCHSTSGGLVSTSLARAVTGLSEKEVQHIFHALKREAGGMAAPSELQITEWRARQYDLLTRCKRMSDTRMDKLRDRLFRTRGESVPDGPTFHAWSTIEARARQEVALRAVGTAVDLDPPGSQAHLYDLGEDGRPKRVWYASYGSNLHRDRFMNYIKGGKPEGSSRTYFGCTDPTEPAGDIPIRFAGARPHFALTSRVWHGGIAFIDAQKGESAHGLGRAYDIAIDQFDEVVAQENGGSTTLASKVPLDEALVTGRAVIGNGSYETILHIGDYEGAPVLTFTAPFSTREALTGTGHITRTPVGSQTAVRMPVLTNKPSPAYLRMIGSGLEETFGMDEIAQADYLRGCPGGDRWSRQQMVRILRGQEPDPERAPGPENPRSVHAKTTKDSKDSKDAKGHKDTGKQGSKANTASTGATTVGTNAAGQPSLFSHSKGTGASTSTTTGTTGKGSKVTSKSGTPEARISQSVAQIRTPQNRRTTGEPKPLPGVKTYASVEEKQQGARKWHRVAQEAVDMAQRKQQIVDALKANHAKVRANNDTTPERLGGIERALTNAEVEAARAAHYAQEATEKYHKALNQRPARYYRTDQARTLAQWQDEDANLISQQRQAEQSVQTEKDRLREMRLKADVSDDALAQQAQAITTLEAHLDGINGRLQETFDIINAIKDRPAPTSTPVKSAAPNGKATSPPTASSTVSGSGSSNRATTSPKGKGKNRKTNPRQQRNPGRTSR